MHESNCKYNICEKTLCEQFDEMMPANLLNQRKYIDVSEMSS